MTTPLLDFDGQVVDRKVELSELHAAVDEAGRAGGNWVLLSGEPGVGKSTLVQLFGSEVTKSDGVFAYGRCRDGAAAPYAALGDALRSMVHTMNSTAPAERARWRAGLLSGASTLGGVLGELVPELTQVLGDARTVARDVDAADARRRLHRAAIRLVSTTAIFRPVVLTMDDLQWADGDSLLFMSELLNVSPDNVLVLGAHRAGEFDAEAAGLPIARLHNIELTPLEPVHVEELLANVTGRSVELGDVAAEFHHRTAGNPLQIRQLLYRAQTDGALIPVGASGQPTWDLRVLSAIEVTATAAEFLGGYLDLLNDVDRRILRLLTCLGAEFDLDDATAAADETPDVVVHALWSAMELRLLEAVDAGGRRIANAISRDARYRFSHDRVAEAAGEGLSDADARVTHLRIGRRFVELGEVRLFDAARHIGVGGVELTDDERTRFVHVLRRAALKARAQTSFPLALLYSNDALALLGDQRWTAQFELTRELQLEAAEAAMLVGEVGTLHELLDDAEGKLNDPADRARLAYLRLKGRVAENRLKDALETGLRALDELGEPVPPHPGKPRMAVALVQMKLTMRRWTNDKLLELPRCEDRRVVEVQHILSELRSMSYMVQPNIFPLVVRKQLELMLEYGHTPSSPLALASYGLLLVFTGDLTGSQRFGEIGQALTEPQYFPESRPEAMFLYLNFIRHWQHPIADALGQLRDAVTAALDQGDQEYAGFLAAALLAQSFWVGRPMAEVDALARSLIPQIRSQPAPTALCQGVQQFCLNLMGRSEDPLLLAGESGFDERVIVAAARDEGDSVALGVVEALKQGLYFWSGDYVGAAGVGDDALAHSDGLVGTAPLQSAYVLNSLSMIRNAPRSRSTRRFIRQSIALHRKWAAAAPSNYAASLALIEGAWAHACGKQRPAERHLEQAIELAEEHRLQLVGAMAYEEVATLYNETGRTRLRRHMLRAAYQRFSSLGMAVRTDQLTRENPWLLTQDLVSPDAEGVDALDAHRLLRALSTARTADDLATLVLGAVADAARANRVLFLTGEGEHLTARAEHTDGQVTRIEGPWTDLTYDASLVNRIIKTRSPLTTGDPATMVVPITVQDKIIGAIYAEHNKSGQQFTIDDEHAVGVVCAQAAAPLWNFHLEARLRNADEHRQSLMDVQSRFVPNELLRILDIDDLRRVRSGYRVDREMTVLISDIRGYTTMLEDMDVSEASNLAMGFLRAVEMPIISCNGMIQDVRGDEIVAVFESQADGVRAGLAMLRSMREHNRERIALGTQELRAGVGLNTGHIGVTLVGGVNRMVLTIIGDTVNLAARIESTTKRYGSSMLMSGATLAGLSDPEEFDIRRMERVMVVNRRKAVTIFEVYDEDPPELRDAKRAAQPAFDEAFALFDAGDNDEARAAFERCQRLLPDDPVAQLHLAHCDAVSRGEITAGSDTVLAQK